MMTEIFQAFKGQSSTPFSSVSQTTLVITEGLENVRRENITQVVTKEPLFQTKGETDDMETKGTEDKVKKEQEPERPTRSIPISIVRPLMRPNLELEMMNSPSTIKLTDTTLEIHISQPLGPEQLKPSSKKLVPASKEVCPDPDAPILVPYEINGKTFQLSEEQIQAHMDKEEKIKKAAEEAKMFEMTKTKSAVPAPIREQASSQSLGRNRKHMELEPKIKVPGLECNRSVPEGVPFVNNM
ncbi:hypothetical protein Tco_0838127 [Tanacetum coccineum]|uniref:Uncharacterized protein n=1 Tax=Tanacetum coccineum TaxID=301880 RepID=A0ABQ5ALW2_9ASTR